MYKIRSFVNPTLLLTLFYSIIYSHLLYGIHVWGSACDTYVNRLLILQKKVVRMITYNDARLGETGPLPHSLPLFHQLELLKVNEIFKLQLSRFIFDCVNNLSPPQFKPWFTLVSDVHDHATRAAFNITGSAVTSRNESTDQFIRKARTTHCGLKAIRVYGPKLWNKNPRSIRLPRNGCSFVMLLKRHFISSYQDV